MTLKKLEEVVRDMLQSHRSLQPREEHKYNLIGKLLHLSNDFVHFLLHKRCTKFVQDQNKNQLDKGCRKQYQGMKNKCLQGKEYTVHPESKIFQQDRVSMTKHQMMKRNQLDTESKS